MKTIASLLVAMTMVVGLAGAAPVLHHGTPRNEPNWLDDDPISGEWDVIFKVQGTTTPATFTLKLDRNKVTGTANSAHTGPGTVRDGSWIDNKLSCTLDFKSHESIAVTGTLKEGKLFGEFRTEGFVANWEATKKAASTINSTPPASDPISGEWDATFAVGEQTAQMTLRLRLAGTHVTGTTESAATGSGPLSNGLWVENNLSFTMDGPHGPMSVTGVLKDGKLAGSFEMGTIKGRWDAIKK